MKQPIRAAIAALLLSLTCIAAEAQPPATPEAFLKWSMDRHAALTSYQAKCAWTARFGTPAGMTSPREVALVKPNRYRVVSHNGAGSFVQTSVSDGKSAVDYSNRSDMPSMTYPAPASIPSAATMQMQHPMFCGSLLYQFFGGAANYSKLVQPNHGKVSFGPDETIGGQKCKTVRFYGAYLYGNTEVAIASSDGLVRRITYDSEPLMKMVTPESMKAMKAQLEKDPKTREAARSIPTQAFQRPQKSTTTEAYTNIILNQPIAASVFSTALPPGSAKPMAMPSPPSREPPVALGGPAPDIQVTGMNGRRVKISSLRGKVVLLDFWATWCPPCRRGLPETQKLAATYGNRGLAVLAISDEKQETVSRFLQQNRYSFPAYLDSTHAAGRSYKTSAIPTVAIIDRSGRLSSYFVGLQSPETIREGLKKAGLAM